MNAAQTGHLVFTTLHTNSAAAAFARLIDLGVDYRTLGNAVNLVLGQRLVRVLCEHCKKARAATAEEFSVLERLIEDHPAHITIAEPLEIFEAAGCEVCGHTGYKGRLGIYEAIRVDTGVEDAIIRDPREHVIKEAAKHQGIPTMQQDGASKVISGMTSFDELTRVIDVYRDLQKKKPADGADDFSAHIV